jgi:two-component system cell cycle sensor histidine kinase/response regulator CckA
VSVQDRSTRPSELPARIARWFIPPAVEARGREAVIRSQAILVAVAAALVMGPISAILDLRLGLPAIGILGLVFVALAAVVPFVLRATGSLGLAGNLAVTVLFFNLLLPGLLTLGRGPAVAFLFMIPLFAVVLASRRAAIAWTVLAAGCALLLSLLASSSLEALVVLPRQVPGRFHRIGLVALLVSAACILTYDLMKAAALADLEQANAALRESREQFRRLIQASPDAVFVTRRQHILFVNSRGRDLLGAASDADLVGRHGSEFLVASPDQLAQYDRGSDVEFRAEGVRLLLRRLSGDLVPVEANASPTLFEGEPATLSIVRDRRPEERNLARLRLLGTVVEQAHEGVIVVDAARVVRYVNEAFAASRGVAAQDLIGRSVEDLARDAAARDILRSLTERLERGGGVAGGRFTAVGSDAARVWDIRVFPVENDDARGPARVALVRDVSHETELEERARQSQKMEAVGQLAGGIAHDFNNHLTVILGHADELRDAVPAETDARAAVEAIVAAADRSAALTQQLLAFARRQALDVRILDVAATVRGMHDMLRRLLPERISLALALDDDVPPVLADRGQIEQVVLNLVLNARDAIAEGGHIEIAARGGGLPEKLREPGDLDGEEEPQEYAVLAVTDDGHGIEEAVRRRIFDPFFTTKPAGRGTGLGLSTVHGIVHQSGGVIDVAPRPGGGTAMTVYLPAADPEEIDLRVAPERRPVPLPTSGVVLLVEDELSVRRLARRAFESAGYRVLEAADGESALRLAQSAVLDLVVTDIVMPGMSGLQLAERIAVTHPGVPVLFVSGYAEDTAEMRRLRTTGRELLGKPFRPQQLVDRARELLATARGFV